MRKTSQEQKATEKVFCKRLFCSCPKNMEISRAEKIFEHPPVKDQQLEKAVKEIKEKEKTVQPADANDRPDEDGKGGRINIKV